MGRDDTNLGDDSVLTSASQDSNASSAGGSSSFQQREVSQHGSGEFHSPSTGQHGAGEFQSPPTGQHGSGGFRSSPTGLHATGGFQSPPTGQHATGGFHSPPTDQHAAQSGLQNNPATGPQTSFNTTGSLSAVNQVSGQMRVAYGAAGFICGAVAGLALGLLNSALEGVTIFDGLGLTLQISGWFAILFGVVCAWKPERVVSMLRQWDIVD